MFFVARMLPFPCLITTTTKVGFDQITAADLCLSYSDFVANPGKLAGKKVIWVSPTLSPEHRKVTGFIPILFSRFSLYAASMNLPVVIEADGAHERHIKSPADHEPAIPPETTMMLHLTGLDVLDKPVSDRHVHRVERFMEITGAAEDDVLCEELIVKNILHPQGGFKNAPGGCRCIAVLTHADTPERVTRGMNIAGELVASGQVDCVWLTRLFPIQDRFVTVIRSTGSEHFIFDAEDEG